MRRLICLSAGVLALSGCTSQPPETEANAPAEVVLPQDDRILRFTGTEPFWGGSVEAGTMTYSTPENIDGTRIAVTRFDGRGGYSYTGTMGGEEVVLAIAPGACSDGMSDRSYPLNATLSFGAETRSGCAWHEGDDLGEP